MPQTRSQAGGPVHRAWVQAERRDIKAETSPRPVQLLNKLNDCEHHPYVHVQLQLTFWTGLWILS